MNLENLTMLADATATDPLISGNWLIGITVAVIGALSTGAAVIIGKLKVDEAKRQTVTLNEPLPEFPTRKVSTPPSWDAHRAVCDRVSRLEEAFAEMRREQASQYRDMMHATNGIETRLGDKLDGIARAIHARIDEIYKPKSPRA